MCRRPAAHRLADRPGGSRVAWPKATYAHATVFAAPRVPPFRRELCIHSVTVEWQPSYAQHTLDERRTSVPLRGREVDMVVSLRGGRRRMPTVPGIHAPQHDTRRLTRAVVRELCAPGRLRDQRLTDEEQQDKEERVVFRARRRPQAWVVPRSHGHAKAAVVAAEYDEFAPPRHGGHGERSARLCDLLTAPPTTEPSPQRWELDE